MKAVIQRVSEAQVLVDKKVVGECKEGLLVFYCAVEGDTLEDNDLLAAKISNLRIFEDENNKMNKSILDVGGEILCISQFTLAASLKKGNRPAFVKAMNPTDAAVFYDKFCDKLRENGISRVETGIFGADMKVSLLNDGPVTIVMDTDIWKKKESTL